MNCASDRNGSKETISFSEKFLRSARKNRVEGRLKEGKGLLNTEDLKDTQGKAVEAKSTAGRESAGTAGGRASAAKGRDGWEQKEKAR